MQPSLRFEKLRRWYVAAAVTLLNCVLAAAFFGGVFVLVQKIRAALAAKSRVSPVERKYGDKTLKAYPDMSGDEVRTLLWETWTRPCVFEAFTHFKERPFSGGHVNVSAHGFRHSNDQATWPPDTNAFNVFVFGGSTLFGYGLADSQTVPSFLQAWLRTNAITRANVYNFGRAYYYSSQEIVLFMRLLAADHIPNLALFLDGLNDAAYVDDLPKFSNHLRATMEAGKAAKPWFNRPINNDAYEGETLSAPSEDIAHKVVRRYQRNMSVAKVLADGYGIQIAFIWQPIPTYKYDLQYHAFKDGKFKRHANARPIYELMEREQSNFINDASFIWCADLQERTAQALYVDEVHYNAVLSHMLAERIGEALQARGFLSRRTSGAAGSHAKPLAVLK